MSDVTTLNAAKQAIRAGGQATIKKYFEEQYESCKESMVTMDDIEQLKELRAKASTIRKLMRQLFDE